MPQHVKLPDSLNQQLRAYESRLKVMETIFAFCAAGLFVVLSFLAVYLSDRFWDTPSSWRVSLLLMSAFALVAALYYWLRKWILHPRKLKDFAKLIQHEHPELGDRLQGIVELTESDQENISPQLLQAAVRQVAEESKNISFVSAVHRRQPYTLALALFLFLGVSAALLAYNQDAVYSSFMRWLQPAAERDRYTFVSLEEMDSDIVVEHGKAFRLKIHVSEDSFIKPDSAWAQLGEQQPIIASFENGLATFEFPELFTETPVHFKVFDARKDVRIIPVLPPVLKKIDAYVKYPAYLNRDLAVQGLEAGKISVLEGSEISLRGHLAEENFSIERDRLKIAVEDNKVTFTCQRLNRELTVKVDPEKYRVENGTFDWLTDERIIQVKGERFLKHAQMQEADRKTSLRADNRRGRFYTAFMPASNGSKLSFSWQDHYGLKSPKSYPVTIATHKDKLPEVEFHNHPQYIAILVDESLEITLQAQDDYGLKEAGVEWRIADHKGRERDFTKYSQVIKKGGPVETRLSGKFLFDPTIMKIPEQSIITLWAYTRDYHPKRDTVKSRQYQIYVLSRAEHAKLIKDRFEAMQTQLEEVIRAEENIMELTKQLSELDPADLASEKIKEQIKALKEAQQSAKQDLDRMLKEGTELLKEAMRNKDLSPELLKEWAKMLESMRDVNSKEMQSAGKNLDKALRNPPNSQKELKQAAEDQKKAIQKLQKLLKNLDESIEQMTARNFVNRLRELATAETGIKSAMKLMMTSDSLGLDYSSLNEEQKKKLNKLVESNRFVRKETAIIMDDLSQFFNRTRIEKYEKVSKEMQKVDVLDLVAKLTKSIEENKVIDGISRSGKLAEMFAQWATMLQGKSTKGQGEGQGQQMTSEQLRLLIKLLRIVQEEENIRSKTRILEKRKDFDEGYDEKSFGLAKKQKDLQKQTEEILPKLPANAREMLEKAIKAMDDAAALLNVPQTDGVTIAAETEVIELLTAGANSAQQSMGQMSPGMAAMLRQLMMEMGMNPGNNPGAGSLQGGGIGEGTDPGNQGTVKGPKDKRSSEKYSGKSLEQIPKEYRDALKSFMNEMEKLNE